MTDIEQPDKLPRWASQDVASPQTGVLNVVEPPDSKKNVGWNSFEQPARNFENWLNRTVYRWLQFFKDRVVDRQPVTDGNGTKIFNKDNVLITLTAIDKTNPNNFIHAVGYRAAGSAPILNTVSSNVLGLGSASSDGSINITGGATTNIIIYGQMQKFSN
jgi:hypothetical protein